MSDVISIVYTRTHAFRHTTPSDVALCSDTRLRRSQHARSLESRRLSRDSSVVTSLCSHPAHAPPPHTLERSAAQPNLARRTISCPSPNPPLAPQRPPHHHSTRQHHHSASTHHPSLSRSSAQSAGPSQSRPLMTGHSADQALSSYLSSWPSRQVL